MFCASCGAQLQDGSKFCSGCGKPVPATTCPRCGYSIKPESAFCPNCGNSLKNSGSSGSASSIAPHGITSDLKELAPGEAVLMDSGRFPISYVKNVMSSINGKLYLTNQRLVFKAGKLQSDAGMFGGDAASKSRQYFSIPLSEVVAVEPGMVTLIVQAGEKYKFGGMRQTKEWAVAILGAAGRN
jgi:hypothetical protein